jgi:hypothetical protein
VVMGMHTTSKNLPLVQRIEADIACFKLSEPIKTLMRGS